MPGEVFFDTNVLIYVLAEKDPRSIRAEGLLAAGGVVSVQGLNEFVAVARRKMQMSWKHVKEAIDAILILCPKPVPLTVDTHEAARLLANRYRYEIYDALVLAAALRAGCSTLYSDDLHDGQVIEGKLKIRNPFS